MSPKYSQLTMALEGILRLRANYDTKRRWARAWKKLSKRLALIMAGRQIVAHSQAKRFGEFMARITELEEALREIAEKDGLCIYGHDPEFQRGSANAFAECAGIARELLKEAHVPETHT